MQEHESHRRQCVASYKCCSSSKCIYICHMTPPLLTLPAAAAQCKPNSGPDNNVDAIKRNITELFVDNAASAPEIVEETNAQIVYKLPADTIRQEIEEFMQYKASNLGIASWDLAQLGLSDIYYNLLA